LVNKKGWGGGGLPGWPMAQRLGTRGFKLGANKEKGFPGLGFLGNVGQLLEQTWQVNLPNGGALGQRGGL